MGYLDHHMSVNFVHLRSLNHNYPFFAVNCRRQSHLLLCGRLVGGKQRTCHWHHWRKGSLQLQGGMPYLVSLLFQWSDWDAKAWVPKHACLLMRGGGGGGTHLHFGRLEALTSSVFTSWCCLLDLGIEEWNFNMFSLNMQRAQLWLSTYHSVVALVLLESTHWKF